MMTFPIPVVALGPGSQPLEDEIFATLDMPSDMPTFRPPLTELDAAPEVVAAALDFLRALLAAMQDTPYGASQPVKLSLSSLPPAVAREVDDLLGEGEVAIRTGTDLKAQETAFTGIWRIRGDGVDDIEASAFPSVIRALALSRAGREEGVVAPPAGLMNAPALLHEIHDASPRCRPGDAAHTLNLSLLPVTPEDLAWLDEKLGRSGLSILSRGFGNCRITAAELPNVWWVQFFNNMEKLILNSIEVVDVPAIALAAADDYDATRVRLAEWIASLESAQ